MRGRTKEQQAAHERGYRICPACQEEKPFSEYHGRAHPVGRCKPCAAEYQREKRSRPQYREQRRAAQRKDKYGLTREEFNALVAQQNGLCAICQEPPTEEWHVDHDHACCPAQKTCGQCVRGLLCRSCNHAIGHFKDDPNRVMAGAAYLIQHQKEAVSR